MSAKQIASLQKYKPSDGVDYVWGFFDEYRYLSNFHMHPIKMPDMITYPSTEHAYQAAKTRDFEVRRLIAQLPTPGQAQRFGQQVELRDDWGEIKLDIMGIANVLKFANKELMTKLQSASPKILVEANWWGDRFWGMSWLVEQPKLGVLIGQNILGQILMEIRDN